MVASHLYQEVRPEHWPQSRAAEHMRQEQQATGTAGKEPRTWAWPLRLASTSGMSPAPSRRPAAAPHASRRRSPPPPLHAARCARRRPARPPRRQRSADAAPRARHRRCTGNKAVNRCSFAFWAHNGSASHQPPAAQWPAPAAAAPHARRRRCTKKRTCASVGGLQRISSKQLLRRQTLLSNPRNPIENHSATCTAPPLRESMTMLLSSRSLTSIRNNIHCLPSATTAAERHLTVERLGWCKDVAGDDA